MTTRVDGLPEHERRAVVGHRSEFERLLGLIDERPGLVVLAADPLSGATGVVRAAVTASAAPAVYVDARGARGAADLATAIADAAIGTLRPEAAGWWRGIAPPTDPQGIRLRRAVVDVADLRAAAGPADRLLRIALGLSATLAGDGLVLAIDHADDTAGAQPDALALLRAAAQDDPGLDLLLVGRPAGRVVSALGDARHPLFRAGQLEVLHRAPPSRFVDDLAIAPSVDAPHELVGVAADLAAGVPAYVWATVDLAGEARGSRAGERALRGWQRVRAAASAATGQQFDLLRAVHPVAQPVLTAIAAGAGPYTVPVNDGRIRAALRAMQDRGVVWQPRRRDWAIADPLLSAWVRDHAQPWARTPPAAQPS